MRGFKFDRSFYVPKGAVKQELPAGAPEGAELYFYEGFSTAALPRRPYAVGFSGKRQKPDFHNWYANEAARSAAVAGWLAGIQRHADFKAQVAAERKAAGPGLAVGDVLSTHWGYDQTNVEFLQVIDVKGKTATVREIAHQPVEGSAGFMCHNVRPAKDKFVGEPVKKLARNGSVNWNGHSASKTSWDRNHYVSWYA